MSKLTLSIAVCVALVVAMPARAQFGISAPKVPGGGGGATAADVNSFLMKATDADKLVNESALQLYKAVSSKEAIEKVEAELKAAGEIKDPAERQAKIDKINADIQAELAKKNWSDAQKKLAAEHSEKKNEAVKSGLYNLALGALKDTELVGIGKKLVSGVPSPDVADKIPQVKDTITKLANQADGLGKVVGGAKSLMSTVGLEALPTKASEEPKSSNPL